MRHRDPRRVSRRAAVADLLRRLGTTLLLLFFFIVLLVFAAFIWATPAFAAPNAQANIRGKIQIRYSKEGAAYDVYRLFDIVAQDEPDSERPTDGEPDVSVPAAFDYVIPETVSDGDGTSPNPWWTFLTTYGPDGAKSKTPYAILSTETSARKRDAAYFIISDATTSLGSKDDYHAIVATKNYPIDSSTSSISSDANQNHVVGDVESKTVQDFAKAALEWVSTRDLTNRQGRYVAVGRETRGSEAEEADAGANVYQYSGDTAFVDDIPLGYYLLGTATGTFVLLTRSDNSAFVYDKNEQPELFMQVRAKGSPASCAPYDQLDEEQQHDLLWSEEYLVNWSYRTNVNVGDYVQFKTVIIAKQDVTDYHLHNVMETGLTFVDDAASDRATGLYDDAALRRDGAYDYSPHVYLYNQANDAAYEIPQRANDLTNWVIRKGKGKKGILADGCDFEVEFRDAVDDGAKEEKMTFAYLDASNTVRTVDITDWDRVVITYWARVNEDAVVFGSDKSIEDVNRARDLSAVADEAAGKGGKLRIQAHTDSDGNNRNTCSSVLSYGNKSHTTWARAEVSLYQFDIAKTALADEGATFALLPDAQLSLYAASLERSAGFQSYSVPVDGRSKTFYYDADAPIRFERAGNTYSFVSEVTKGFDDSVAVLRSSKEGPVNVRGIEAGTYVLVEDMAPNDYEKIANPIVLTIHDAAYLNTDMMENNNPGSRHTNEEGDVTVTTKDHDGIAETNVCTWHTKVVDGAAKAGGVHIVNQLSAEAAAARDAAGRRVGGLVMLFVAVVAGMTGFAWWRLRA